MSRRANKQFDKQKPPNVALVRGGETMGMEQARGGKRRAPAWPN
jgi:ribosomal protein L4